MSFSVGIIGLPNVGKSTLFKALTKKQVDIADYPFTTIKPNVGLVTVPDKRLEKIAQIIKPKKITPTIIEFIDIAGLVKNAHKGDGLGNQFLAQIKNCDALVQVVKAFNNNIDIKKEGEEDKSSSLPTQANEVSEASRRDKVSSPLANTRVDEEDKSSSSSLRFVRDIEIIKTELELKDLDSKEKENLLSKKPIIHLFNINNKARSNYISLNLKDEEGFSELSKAEKKELNIEPKLDQLILNCYNILDLITFYTITGGKECRAWTVKKRTKCPEAGRKIHSDFEEKFIRAEVINWQKLVDAASVSEAGKKRQSLFAHASEQSVKKRQSLFARGSWKRARELGQILIAGKEYIVQDGDVIEFKI